MSKHRLIIFLSRLHVVNSKQMSQVTVARQTGQGCKPTRVINNKARPATPKAYCRSSSPGVREHKVQVGGCTRD